MRPRAKLPPPHPERRGREPSTFRQAQGRPEHRRGTRASGSSRAEGRGMTRISGIDLALARKVLQTEADAILALVNRLDDRFEDAIRILLDCRGRVIVTGMGKSGIIARKIAATLSSTGTSAFFLHPAEAIHGDLRALQRDDL